MNILNNMNVLTSSLQPLQQGGYLQQITIKQNATNCVGSFPMSSFIKNETQEGIYQIKHLSIPLGLIISNQKSHKPYSQNEQVNEITEQMDNLFSKFSSPKPQKKTFKIIGKKNKKTKKYHNH